MNEHLNQYLRAPYMTAAAELLAGFQLVEISLMVYAAAAYEVIKKSLDGRLSFDYGYKDVENMSLERLIGTFARLNGNKKLIGKLRHLVRERNWFAHRGLVAGYGIGPSPPVSELMPRIEKQRMEIKECLNLLAEEMKKVEALKRENESNNALQRTPLLRSGSFARKRAPRR